MAGENVDRLLRLASEFLGGGRSKKLGVAAIEGELAVLLREREAAMAAKSVISERRRAAVMAGESFETIRGIEDDGDRLDIVLEQLEGAEAPIRARLRDAQSSARREQWRRRAGQVQAAVKDYAEKARVAAAAGHQLLRLRSDVFLEFNEIGLLTPVPALAGGALVIDTAIIENWLVDCERFFEALPQIDQNRGRSWDGAGDRETSLDYSRRPDDPPAIFGRPAPPAPEPPPRRERRSPAPSTMPAEPPRGELVAKQLLDTIDLRPGADGLVGMHFVRRYEASDGTVQEAGERRVTPGVALAALRAGAGDLVEQAAVPPSLEV